MEEAKIQRDKDEERGAEEREKKRRKRETRKVTMKGQKQEK